MARAEFQNLQVYRLAEQLADEAWSVVRQWAAFARHAIGLQLVRVAGSGGANIPEGAG